MTDLERVVAELSKQLAEVKERVRVDAVAELFIAGNHDPREGDYFLLNGFPTKLTNISSEGKWTYFNGNNVIEPFRIPQPGEVDRLYTVAEVAEIVSKVARKQ